MENKPGMLAELANALNENKINMRALSLAETKDFGIIRLILDDPFNAVRVDVYKRQGHDQSKGTGHYRNQDVLL